MVHKLIILLIPVWLFASNFGKVQVIGPDKTPAKVTSDSALFVAVNGLSFNGDSALKVTLPGTQDAGNSTETPLIANDSFVGVGKNILNYASICLLIKSDKASATKGISVQFSCDSSTWHSGESYTYIQINESKFFTPPAQAKYYRVVYTNGDTAQTYFHLHTTLKKTPIKWSGHNVGDSIKSEDDAELVKAVLAGEDENGIFQNVKTSVDGDLSIYNNSDGLAISSGRVTGATYVHKFGSAPDFDYTDGQVTVWDGAEDGTTWEKFVYTYSTTADIQYISSSDNGDTGEVKIQGLDSDFNLVTQVKNLTGQTSATLTTPLVRVFRMKNNSNVDFSGHVFVSTSTAPGTGIPTVADIRCIVQPENNQTEMAIYTVPAGKKAYVRSWYASSAGANKTTNIIIRLRAREQGGVWQLKHKMAWNGEYPYQHEYHDPEKFEEKVDIEMTCELTASGVTGAAISAGFDIALIDD